jgi:Type II secretion system (T2SS), protein E, N-terminal domain
MNMAAASVIQVHDGGRFRWRFAQPCAGRQCSRSRKFWRRILYDTPTIQFQGSAFCFPGCFERELLRRLERTSRTLPTTLRPRRIPIGLLMLSRGNLTNDQLQRALAEQKQAGAGRIGEWFRRLGLAEELDVAAALAMQWSCPLVRKLPLESAPCGVPVHLLRTFRMAPVQFSRASGKLHLAFAGEIAYPALVAVEQMLEIKTEACFTTQPELNSALDRLEESRPPEEKVFENFCGPEELVRIVSGYVDRLHALEVRTVGCGNYFWVRILGHSYPVDLIFRRRNNRLDEAIAAV